MSEFNPRYKIIIITNEKNFFEVAQHMQLSLKEERYTKLIVFKLTKCYKDKYPDIVFGETNRLSELSMLINECLINVYHDSVKEVPMKSMFNRHL